MGVSGGMSEYLGVFLDEADEQVETLDQGILRLEGEPENQDLLQEIFRAAHSLKSASAAMGFAHMSHLTHAAEDLLDKFRIGEMRPQTASIDALLAAVDALKTMKDAIRGGGNDALDIDSIAERLRAVGSKSIQEAKVSRSENELPATSISVGDILPGQHTREVIIHLCADCEMRSVRAHLVMNALESLGRILRTDPSREDISAGRLGLVFRVILDYEGESETIRNMAESISEVERAEVASDPRVVDVGPAGRGKSPQEIAALAKRSDQTVRVNVARLDKLMNLVGELVIDRTRITQLGIDVGATYGNTELAQQLRETSLHMGRIVGDLQEEIMKTRMLPIAQLFQRFPRMVRDLAHKMNKEVELALEGEGTELDRSVIEELVDPLTHLLRNAVDHGIEDSEQRLRAGKSKIGRITLSARQLENNIIIEVSDDGAGIDVEKLKESAIQKGLLNPATAATLSRDEALQLIFAPGLSTVSEVSDVSGRGVGMDVVRSNVNRIHGTVRIRTAVGTGTTIAMSLPLTLAISQALLVSIGSAVVAIPLVYVVETTRIPACEINTIKNRLVMPFRDRVLPLVALSEVFEQQTATKTEAELIYIVVTKSGEQQIGLMVDNLIGEQEIVLKPLGSAVGEAIGISGATILGNGTVALVLDVASLLDRAELHAANATEIIQLPSTVVGGLP